MKNILKSTKEALIGIAPDPAFESQQLLCALLNCSRIELLRGDRDLNLSASQKVQLEQWLIRRKREEPLAYILEKVAFWTFDALFVNKDVLIPRPETELLVELTLKYGPDPNVQAQVLDLGTGSGAIALALASERPNWQIMGLDFSSQALLVAKKNSNKYGFDKIQWIQSNWLEAVMDPVDLIVSNPPYIAVNDSFAATAELSYEPADALYSEEDGFYDLHLIIDQAKNKLKANGLLVLEHGFRQAEYLSLLLLQAGYNNIKTYKDISGKERVTISRS